MYLNARRRRSRGLGLTPQLYAALQNQRDALVQGINNLEISKSACSGGEGGWQECVAAINAQINQLGIQLAVLDAQLAQGIDPAPAPAPMPQPVTGPGGPPAAPVVVPGPISPTPGAIQPAAPGAPIALEVEGGGGGDFLMPSHGASSSASSSCGNGLLLLALAAGAVLLGG